MGGQGDYRLMAGEFPMSPVEGSSAIEAHGYDTESRKMRVKFKGGKTYELDDVPPERYAAFTGANSMGNYYNKRVAPLHVARRVK